MPGRDRGVFFGPGVGGYFMDEKLYSLGEATGIVPTSNGRRVSTATLWRWCSKGINGHKLRHYRFGKRIAVTQQDILEFGAAVAAAHGDAAVAAAPARRTPRTPTDRTPEERKAAADQAKAELQGARV